MAPDALAESVEGQLRVVCVGAHLGPPGNVVESVGCNQVELAQHLAVDVAQILAVIQPQAESGARPNALAGRHEPEAARQHGVRRQHALLTVRALEWDEQELAPTLGLANGCPSQRRYLIRRRAQENRRRGRRLEHGAAGRASDELFRDDREIRQLRHGKRGAFDRMVCYPGRVADNPIVARERVDSSAGVKEHRVVSLETTRTHLTASAGDGRPPRRASSVATD